MIRSIQNRIPRIRFQGFNSNWLVLPQNKKVKIWLSTIYNTNEFESTLITNLQFTKVSDYEYEVTGDLKGFNKIELSVLNKDKSKSISSNSLILIVS